MHNTISTHVEAHAAAVMRQTDTAAGTLYINRVPCPRTSPSTAGCAEALPSMLGPGQRLTVWAPDDYGASFIGRP